MSSNEVEGTELGTHGQAEPSHAASNPASADGTSINGISINGASRLEGASSESAVPSDESAVEQVKKRLKDQADTVSTYFSPRIHSIGTSVDPSYPELHVPGLEDSSKNDPKSAQNSDRVDSPNEAPKESTTSSETSALALFKIDDREKLTDVWVNSPTKEIVNDHTSFHRKVLTRVSAKKIRFKNVSFFQTIFDTCYFNNCVFDSCTFIGCRFVASNLHQSSFPSCKFDYAVFERTQVDDDILSAAPERQNLKLKFARTLRMNYQQIGDARAVNRAIVLELEATEVFLKESWRSDSEYYRKKYIGFSRFWQFFRWLEFMVLDFIWGNGESVTKLLRSIILVILGVGLVDMIYTKEAKLFMDYLKNFYTAPSLFLGVEPLPKEVPSLLASGIAALRLVGFAFLTAILVKRFGRR
ncbi:pentapeptide repeat-containing protein [Pseudomonas syringae]|uniref:pentapeptide repeat-containing protein n=1 Tax=Pseudomonas syringae TaxID=317 RepID=UPI00200A2285|nr:pentapeptide repeat-containing protein [Pseudomonas syringae]MCK9744987.1 pentapeptide repeat-containing protein [Pseudomonas syringae pv. syringae]MCK9767278.1 pentapeptide repeat-containing protein [Pseudomonas syringae pv. syringae]